MDTATAKFVLTFPLVCVACIVGCLWIYVRAMADLFCSLVGMDLRLAARAPRVLRNGGRHQ